MILQRRKLIVSGQLVVETKKENNDNDKGKQEYSSLGVEKGENYSQDKPEICIQASGENGE